MAGALKQLRCARALKTVDFVRIATCQFSARDREGSVRGIGDNSTSSATVSTIECAARDDNTVSSSSGTHSVSSIPGLNVLMLLEDEQFIFLAPWQLHHVQTRQLSDLLLHLRLS